MFCNYGVAIIACLVASILATATTRRSLMFPQTPNSLYVHLALLLAGGYIPACGNADNSYDVNTTEAYSVQSELLSANPHCLLLFRAHGC